MLRRIRVRLTKTPDHVNGILVNVGRGMAQEHSAAKAIGLEKLAANVGFPDLIAMTELFGPAGKGSVGEWLGPQLCAQYPTMLWSQRSVSLESEGAAARGSGARLARGRRGQGP